MHVVDSGCERVQLDVYEPPHGYEVSIVKRTPGGGAGMPGTKGSATNWTVNDIPQPRNRPLSEEKPA